MARTCERDGLARLKRATDYLTEEKLVFGNASQPSKIYAYGCLAPVRGLDLFEDQSRKMHRYRNALVARERGDQRAEPPQPGRRGEVEDVLRSLRPDVLALRDQETALLAELEEARAAVRQGNVQARQRRGRQSTEAQRVREISARLREVRARLRPARQEAFAAEGVRAALAVVEERDLTLRKELRAESGLYWCNYLTVEQSCGSFRQGAPPDFRPWREARQNVRIAVQLQGGMSVPDFLGGGDNRLRFEAAGASRDGRRRFGRVWVRAGSGRKSGREPLWVVVPVVWHRDLPQDGAIKWAYLRRRLLGTRAVWGLEIVVARAEGWERPDAATAGAVGIDLGWRLLKDGSLRVASWIGDDGGEDELCIPADQLPWFEEPSRLRGHRDDLFNRHHPLLRDWIREQDATLLPEWFRERTRTLPHWRSAEALAALVRTWAEQRFSGDKEMFRLMRGWIEPDAEGRPHRHGYLLQHDHLWDWEQSSWTAGRRWRDDLYRNFVARLRRRYRTARIEDTDWSALARRKPAETEERENEIARYHRTVAAPGRLAELIREGFAAHVEVPAEWTTQRCAECGRLDPFDAALELVRTCAHCGHVEDQDRRAARNLLGWRPPEDASGGVVDETPAPARDPQGDEMQEVA